MTELPGRHARPHASAAALDRDRHLAATSSARTSRSSTSISPRTASATARWATRTSPSRSPSDAATLDEIIAELRDHPDARARRPGAWTTRPRTPSSGCARRVHVRRPRPCPHRPARPASSRSSSSATSTTASRRCRPPDPRHRLAARGQVRGDQGHVRAARHAVRVGVPDGRAPGRARPGHHHRHDADPVPDRRSGTTSSSTRPGHKEFLKNMVTGAACAEAALLLIDAARRRAGAVAPARLSAAPARRRPGRGAGQQDGPGRLLGRPVRRGRRGVPRLSRAASA